MRKYLKKIIIYVVLIVIILMENYSIATEITINAGGPIEITDMKDEEMVQILLNLGNYLQDPSLIDMDETEYAETVAEKIVELCDGDIDKMQKLQASYDYNGMTYWGGNTEESPHHNAVNKAISATKEAQSKGDTEITIDKTTQEELIKLGDEIVADMNEIYKMKKEGNIDIEKLKEVDEKIRKYSVKLGDNNNEFTKYAKDIYDIYKQNKSENDHYKTTQEQAEEEKEERDQSVKNTVQANTSTGVLGTSTSSASHTPDEIVKEAENFLNKGNGTATIDGQNLKDASSTLYNILLSIGIFLAVGIGMYLGVKFMVSTAEDKAKVKEALIPYIVGCVVIFTAFIVWRMAILLLGGIA
ncbi:MAG: hypothetical protein J6A04_05760 [Clostridia bacterium]|nr:hypothetical protein [Clostridia bacterium]